MLFDGGEFGTGAAVGSDEEADYLGIPGLLEPDQVPALLQRRQAEQQSSRSGPAAATSGDAPPTTYERLSLVRRELNGLVGAWHHRAGRPHGAIHADLRRSCGGPAAARTGAEELQAGSTRSGPGPWSTTNPDAPRPPATRAGGRAARR